MFNKDFYPTPEHVIAEMLEGEDIAGKTILEPSAGKGNIVDFCAGSGATSILACETNEDLRHIIASKCTLIAKDFMSVNSDQISHIDYIIMNPPFSADEKHILHAFEIAPAGCKIITLCNLETVNNRSYKARERMVQLVEQYGSWRDLGDCFAEAERRTKVEVALVRLQKPAASYEQEFSGFFNGPDPNDVQGEGIMPYNLVRDLVHRYTDALRIFDEQLIAGQRMSEVISPFYKETIAFVCMEDGKPRLRNDFRKQLQKDLWLHIFDKLDMKKYATKQLRQDINNFVERQTHIPFTMRNVYHMLRIVVGTTSQRMDKAVLEVFEKLTEHYHENRYFVEGWKTNSHYLVNRKFIMPYMAEPSWSSGIDIKTWRGNGELVSDLVKALCFITGTPYEDIPDIGKYRSLTPNSWYDWGFFRLKGFKKGTVHFEFKDEEVWALFNQRVAKLKGYQLFKNVKQKTNSTKRNKSKHRQNF